MLDRAVMYGMMQLRGAPEANLLLRKLQLNALPDIEKGSAGKSYGDTCKVAEHPYGLAKEH